MTNTWDAEIATLAPDHYWKLDEASGDYLDTGSVATLDMPESIVGAPWRQAPSIAIRGAPRQHAIWGSMANGSGAVRTASGIQVAGHTTGTFMGVIFCYSLDELGYTILQTFINNAGVYIGIRINLDGSVEFIAQRTGANFSRAISAAGVVTAMTPHLLVGVQRADATGFHIFVDGVDVTSSATQGGTVGVDDYVDQIFSGDAPTDLSLGETPNTTTSTGGYCYGSPGIWVNTALSDSQILDLFNSIGGFTQAPTDWFDFVLNIMDGDCRWWWAGWYDPVSSLRAAGMVQDGSELEQMIGSGFTVAPSASNVADSGGVGEQRITPYNGRHQLVGSNNPSISDGAPTTQIDSINDFTGTINCLVKITSAPVGITHNFFAFGNGVGNDNMLFSIVGSIFGWSVKLRMEATSGDFWQGVGNGFIFADADVHMLTFVQDGNGVRFYVDGSNESFFVTSSGATIDDETWLSDMDILGVPGMQQSGEPASPSVNPFDPNQLHDMFVTRTILTASEVSDLWDAVAGLFPMVDPNAGAPAGGFFETLNGLGNSGQGPDHWWRLNAIAEPIIDIGLKLMTSPNGDSIDTGGDPDFEVTGPLVQDPTNEAINFDGQGDYFEIGVDGITGELVAAGIGSVGFFVSRNDLAAMIAYSQANDLATGVWRLGLNTSQQVELLVQSSTGNSVTLTSSVTQDDLEFHFIVLTNDGATYTLYIDNVVDTSTSLAILGTGAEGDWFDAFTADNSAVAALASSGFLTDTNGRFSEIFIYEEVLTASQVNALWEAALANGLGSSATSVGVLVFEDVTFLNGARADIRLSNSLTTFNQVLQVNRSRFIGGLEGQDAESISLTGEARATVRGCTFDLDTTPTTGRAAILATTADPTAGAVTYGNLIVSDCTFNRMGHGDVEVHPAVFAESGFGMTVEKNRFLDSYVGAIGWRGDARRIVVAHNLIDGVTNGAAAVSCQVGLNTNIGNAWLVRRNTILDVLVGNGISIAGANSSVAQFARDIQIIGNNLQSIVQDGIIVTQIADLVAYGNRIGGAVVEGISIGEILGVVKIQRNFIADNSGDGIAMNEATTQIATLIIDRNTVNAALVGDGMLFDGIDELVITNNKFLNLVNGLELGNIGSSAKFFGNQFEAVSVPLAFVAATTQTGLEIGQNQLTNLGVAELTVAAEAISVFAQDHTVTLAAPANLATINGFETVEGYVMILRLAVGSSNVTVVDTGNINLDAATDFIMDTAGESQIWLVSDGAGSWNELSRALGS